MKSVRFVASSLDDLRALPEEAQKDVGFAPYEAQLGGKSFHAKPLKGFKGAGILEIVEDLDGDSYRAVYTVRLAVAIEAGRTDGEGRRVAMAKAAQVKTAFEEIGIVLSPVDLLKVKVAAAISSHVQASGLTQSQAAAALGVDQPKMSKLLRGRLDEFSLDRLVGYAIALGHAVDLTIQAPKKVA